RTGDRPAGELARRALAPLRRRLATQGASGGGGSADRPRPGRGGLTGPPGILYALVWIGELLAEPALAREALTLSALLDPDRIAADADLDVISGSAGAILGLLAVDGVAPEAGPGGRSALELASLAADRLLARRIPIAPGGCGWAAPGGAPLAGFAHGAAGICHAL